MRFYFVEPEVAGELGTRTIMDRSTHPPKVERLHYDFSGWLGDALLESFPVFIATDAACSSIQNERLTGVQFGPVEVTKSEQFDELYPGRQLPKFTWVKVLGRPGIEDFGLAADHRLVVSERALNVLRQFGLAQAIIEEYKA